jgi:hypothetical protein
MVEDPATAAPVPVSAKVEIGRVSIGMELRRRQRSLANDAPLLQLARELGFADVDALFMAIADHTVAAGDIAERLIRHVDGGSVEAAVAATPSLRRP